MGNSIKEFMTPSEANQKLSEITDVILNDELDIQTYKKALDDLKNLLFGVSGLNFNAKINEQNIQLDNGQAIGPKWAGLCMEDVLRTQRFMRAIYKAVEVKRKDKKSEPVTILYAGAGPFATLILPLLSRYSPEELQLVLLEINEISIESLKRIIRGFEAFDYFKEIYQCDASNYEYTTSNKEIDIFLVECIQHALSREPQVAITHNLLPRLPKDVILIPEQISLEIALVNSDKRDEYMELKDSLVHKDYYEAVKTVFVINKETVLDHKGLNENGQLEFQQETAKFIKERLNANDAIAIGTEITIFDDEKLTIDECGLTTPLIIAKLNQKDKMKGIKTQYLVNKKPGLYTEFEY